MRAWVQGHAGDRALKPVERGLRQVELSRPQVGVAEQLLGLAHVGLLLDQVGEGASQRVRVGVHADAVGDPAHEPPDRLARALSVGEVVPLAHLRVATVRWDDVLVASDGGANVVCDRASFVEHRNPALATALGDLGRDPDPAFTLEVAALEAAQFLVAGAGEQKQGDHSALAGCLAGHQHRERLRESGADHVGLAAAGARDRVGRVVTSMAFMDHPPVEGREHRVALALGVRVAPAAKGRADVLAGRVARVVAGGVVGMPAERVAVGGLALGRVDPAGSV